MKLIIIIILSFIFGVSFSQEIIQINGRVVDINDSTNIKYASVFLKNQNVGTITNDDGFFSITIDKKYKNDTLIISHVSFKRRELIINKIDTNSCNIFYLNPKTNYLKEVVISSDSTYSFLNRVFLATKKKMDIPMLLHTYYKEIVLKNHEFQIFADALLDVYVGNKTILHRVKQSRVIRKNKHLSLDYNPLQIHNLTNVFDAISKQKKDETKTHSYRLQEDTNSKYYIIIASPNKKNINISNLFNVNIYIDKKTILITRIEAKITPENIKKIKKTILNECVLEFLEIEQVISYKVVDDRMHLEYSMMRIRVRRHSNGESSDYLYKSEMQLLGLLDKNVKKFKRKQVFKGNYIYESKGLNRGDFWNNLNIKTPTNEEMEFIINH